MRKIEKAKLLLCLILIINILFPQVAFATPLWNVNMNSSYYITDSTYSKPFKSQLRFQQGEIIFKSLGGSRGEARILEKYNLSIIQRNKRLGYILAKTNCGTDIKQTVKSLANEKGVVYAQPNYLYIPFGKPNDPQYPKQWALQKIDAEEGWNSAKSNSSVIIAVLDTGVDINHPEFKSRLVPGFNTINPLKSARDNDGHGTHVAGIAAAGTNNGLGIAGVAGIPGVKIMPVKVFDGQGGSDISISDGIIWAVDHGAKVLNMSFGSKQPSQVLNEAIDYAYSKGAVMVAAAGNWATKDVSYPAAISKVISVSATDKNNKLCEFSSYGPQIDVCAPGEEIYSTYWDAHKGSTYTEMSGTSMAAAFVSGLAGLILAKNPKLTNDDVRQIIESSATDLGDPGWDPMYGHGLININRALAISLKGNNAIHTVKQSVELVSGKGYKGRIEFGSDVDWYKINVPDRSNLQVEVLPGGKVSPGVEIYDSTGNLLSSFNTGNNNKKDNVFAYSESAIPIANLKVAESVYGLVTGLQGGDYYIKVFGNHFRWSKEDYTITARVFTETELVKKLNDLNDCVEKAKSISVGNSVKGAILRSGQEDWYKLNLTGKSYKIHVDVPNGLNLALDVLSEGSLQESQPKDYLFNSTNPGYYETIHTGGQGQVEEGIVTLPQNAEGTFYIKVYDIGGASQNASYTLSVSSFNLTPDRYEPNETPEQAPNIAMGENVTANFDKEQDEDWYKIQVKDTGILKIDFKPPSDIMSDLYFYNDPKANPVGLGYYNSFYGYMDKGYTENNGMQSFEFKVVPGTYYIETTNYDKISGNSYTIKTEFRPFDFIDKEINDDPQQAINIDLNQTLYGTLYPARDLDFYVVNVEKPQPILVTLTPPTDLDTVAVVMKEVELDSVNKGKDTNNQIGNNDQGQFLGGDANSNGPVLEPVTEIKNGGKGQPDIGVFVPTSPGKYYIMVTALKGKSQNRYSLNVQPFKPQLDVWEPNDTIDKAKVITSGKSIQPTYMGTEDTDWFKIYVPDKGKLKVRLAVPSDIDGVIEIYDPDKKIVRKVDEFMAGGEESAEITVLKIGYYYIKTYDYLGNSSVLPYTLTVSYQKNVSKVLNKHQNVGRP